MRRWPRRVLRKDVFDETVWQSRLYSVQEIEKPLITLMKGLRTRATKLSKQDRIERRKRRNALLRERKEKKEEKLLAAFLAGFLLYLGYRVLKKIYRWL